VCVFFGNAGWLKNIDGNARSDGKGQKGKGKGKGKGQK